MDLVGAYGDTDAPSVIASPPIDAVSVPPTLLSKSRALIVTAPPVQVDDSLDQAFASAGQKLVYYNPTVDYMWTPLEGPSLPARGGMISDSVARNMPTGYVEQYRMDDFQFETQYHTFHCYGYAANPSVGNDPTVSATAAIVGDLTKAGERHGANVFEPSTAALRREAQTGIGKRKAQGDPLEPGYLGPWAPYEVEETEALAFAAAKAERDAKRAAELAANPELKDEESKNKDKDKDKARIPGGGRERDPDFDRNDQAAKRAKGIETVAVERTLFHGDSVLDYQGRTYMHPPITEASQQDKAAAGHSCYIPENLVHTWSGHTRGVSAIRFLPQSGHLLLSGSMDSTIKIWDVYNKRKCLRSYLGHGAAIKDIQFSHDGKTFLSASFDKYMKLWDTETGKCVAKWGIGKTPLCVRWHGDSARPHEFLSGMQHKKIMQWDTREANSTQEYEEHLGPVNAVLFVDNNRRFVSSSDDKKLLFWDYGIPVVIKHISEPYMHSAPYMTMHPSNKCFAVQSLDNSVQVYGAIDRFGLNRKKRFTGHFNAGFAAQVSFSPDGHFVVSGDGEGRVFFWDWRSTKLLRKFKCHDQVTIGALWHPLEPRLVATCSWDGNIKLWQ